MRNLMFTNNCVAGCKSKINLLTIEIESLKSELDHTRKSLEKSVTDCCELKSVLRLIALDKQKFAVKLHRSQQCNVRLAKQRQLENEQFQIQSDRMQSEINEMRRTLEATRSQFSRTKILLETKLRQTKVTTVKLCTAFLRMKEAKKRAHRKRAVYEKMSEDFSNSIKHQAEILKEITSNQLSSSATTIICNRTEFIERLADLMEENANLRRELAAKQIHNAQYRKISKRSMHMKLVDELIDELKKCETNDHVHDQMASASLNDSGTSGEIVIYQRTGCMSGRTSNSF